jgi:NitT/TauT family transport system substrate-binding protein
MVAKFLKATKEGWVAYLKDPAQSNREMQRLNPSMSLDTFMESSKIQKRFIETADTKKHGLGFMSRARWEELYRQLIEVRLVPAGLDVSRFYRQ